jgi:hypothetical protein
MLELADIDGARRRGRRARGLSETRGFWALLER